MLDIFLFGRPTRPGGRSGKMSTSVFLRCPVTDNPKQKGVVDFRYHNMAGTVMSPEDPTAKAECDSVTISYVSLQGKNTYCIVIRLYIYNLCILPKSTHQLLSITTVHASGKNTHTHIAAAQKKTQLWPTEGFSHPNTPWDWKGLPTLTPS